jgi:hypothetical protein
MNIFLNFQDGFFTVYQTSKDENYLLYKKKNKYE